MPSPPEETLVFDKKIGLAVARMRMGLELSQVEFAAVLSKISGWNWHRETLNKIESGKRALRLHEAMFIAEVFGCTVDELTGIEKQSVEDMTTAYRLLEIGRIEADLRKRRRELESRTRTRPQ